MFGTSINPVSHFWNFNSLFHFHYHLIHLVLKLILIRPLGPHLQISEFAIFHWSLFLGSIAAVCSIIAQRRSASLCSRGRGGGGGGGQFCFRPRRDEGLIFQVFLVCSFFRFFSKKILKTKTKTWDSLQRHPNTILNQP